MAADDYYVDVLDAADIWYALTEQDGEPTDAEWNSAHEKLGDAVEALRTYEASAGTSLRDESWGGLRAATFALIDAADAWYALSLEDDDPAQGDWDAVLDRLGEAVQTLRVAEDRRSGLD